MASTNRLPVLSSAASVSKLARLSPIPVNEDLLVEDVDQYQGIADQGNTYYYDSDLQQEGFETNQDREHKTGKRFRPSGNLNLTGSTKYHTSRLAASSIGEFDYNEVKDRAEDSLGPKSVTYNYENTSKIVDIRLANLGERMDISI